MWQQRRHTKTAYDNAMRKINADPRMARFHVKD